jgi:phage/plasmid-like protein (TIGR03299 family)
MVDGSPQQVSKAFCIIRGDTGKVLLPTCGDVMTVQNNAVFFRMVEEGLLNHYPELQIESVGTLWGGQTAFVNIKLAEWAVKGDQSSTISRLMYFNPLGLSYQACAHNVRIVCNNTLRMAAMSGEVNKTLAKFRHTGTAGRQITNYLVNLAELKLGLQRHQEVLNELARRPITTAEVDKFLAAFLPAPEGPPPARVLAQRDQIRNAFESDQSLGTIGKTRYGLLQAVTYTLDHGKLRKDQDETALRWDGIVGGRADKKQQALNLLALSV